MRFYSFYDKYQNNECIFEINFQTKFFDEPSYASVCKVFDPKIVPKRSILTTKDGQIILIHAIGSFSCKKR